MSRTTHDLKEIAKTKGWKLNPNFRVVQAILKSQNKFHEKEGEYYCPCKKEHVPENICPCVNSQNEIDADGHCHCKLFWESSDK